jgi:hypothetical protein
VLSARDHWKNLGIKYILIWQIKCIIVVVVTMIKEIIIIKNAI